MEIKLKPCPFCGCSAGLYQAYDGCYTVQCKVCGNGTLCKPNKNLVIELWNRRTVLK